MNLITVSVTTDSSGDFTGYAGPFCGKLQQIRYVPHATTPLDTGADVAITGETSGQTLYAGTNIGTSAFTLAPRQATHDTAGTPRLYAAAGTAVGDKIEVGGERIKVVVAQGGNEKSGKIYIWLD